MTSKFYEIEIRSGERNHAKMAGKIEIELEANCMYKLPDDGCVISPISDSKELCRIIVAGLSL